jgi:hypothetical protein
MLSATWVEPRKQVAMAKTQLVILMVILRSRQFAPIHTAVRKRLAYAIRRAFAAAVRMRSIRSVGTVLVSIVAGNHEAKRLVRQDRASASQVGC